jgi:thiamine pyrophosphate-dependent acetolactate synthase large subunit-like protein
MKVYERLAAAFAAEGVTDVFGMMGDGNMHWIEALDANNVRMLEVRHEGVGCGMADGWARATHTPGVCTATCGPGVSQLATALVTASRADSGIVAFVGEAPTTDEDFIQYLDQARFAAACETEFVRVISPRTVDEAVQKAFYIARLESRPVMLSAPMDVQQQAFDDSGNYQPSTAVLPAIQGAQPNARLLAQAADIIAGSRRPVLLLGRGALWSNSGDAALRIAHRTGALIATSLRAKGWLADDEFHVGICGQYSTKTVLQLFEEADCVIAVGASLNRYTMLGGLLFQKARVIHLDARPHVRMAGGRIADCYLQTDGKLGLEALDRVLADRAVRSTGYRTAEVKSRLTNHFEDRAEFEIEPGCVDPRPVCLALDEIIPQDIMLLTGTGAHNGFTNMLFNRPRPLALSSQYYGCIGQMMPAAMGAILATGNKPAVVVDGDASILMHLIDFETAVRYKMPLLVIVMNDQALGSEYQKMRAHKMKAELATIPTPDLGGVGVALGGRGRLARTVDEVRSATKEWVARPGPMIIDVRISRNVQTIAYRRTLYAKDE